MPDERVKHPVLACPGHVLDTPSKSGANLLRFSPIYSAQRLIYSDSLFHHKISIVEKQALNTSVEVVPRVVETVGWRRAG
jgi:hypothetical protein